MVLGSAGLVVSRLFSAFTGFLVLPFIHRHLGDAIFGAWALSISILAYATLLDAGLGSVVTVRVTEHLQAGRRGPARAIIRTAVAWYGLVGAGIASLVIVFSESMFTVANIPSSLHSDMRNLLLGITGSWALYQWASTLGAALDFHNRFWISRILPNVGFAANYMAIAFASSKGASLSHLGAITAFVGVCVAATVLKSYRRLFAGGALQSATSLSIRREWRFGGAVQLATVADVANFASDRLILSTLVGVSAVATYELGARVAMVGHMVTVAPLILIFPVLARLSLLPEARANFVMRLARLSNAANGLVVAILLAASLPLLELWLGTEVRLDEVLSVMRFLVVAFGLHALTGVYTMDMRAQEKFGRAATFAVCAAVINIVLTVTLVPSLGAPGAAAASLFGLGGISTIFIAVGNYGNEFGWRPMRLLTKTVVLTGLAAWIGATVASTIQAGASARVVVSMLVAVIAYGITAWVVDAFRVADARFILDAFRIQSRPAGNQ